MSLQSLQTEFVAKFNSWVGAYLNEAQTHSTYAPILLKSQEYSLTTGGKRFRPFLAYLVAELFGPNENKIKSLCLSLEMVHTYSLIHDDLPCMDNDDFRRGKPTNHKVFNEEIALLAGDGLLSDVFSLLAQDMNVSPMARLRMIHMLSDKIGSKGMVSGQVFDMQADQKIDFAQLKKIHTLKTANLIQAAAVGAALAVESSEAELHNISEFSFHLGMAFQIKDDLLDYKDKQQDFKSYVNVLGTEKTQGELLKHSGIAVVNLKALNRNTADLEELVNFNLQRNS